MPGGTSAKAPLANGIEKHQRGGAVPSVRPAGRGPIRRGGLGGVPGWGVDGPAGDAAEPDPAEGGQMATLLLTYFLLTDFHCFGEGKAYEFLKTKMKTNWELACSIRISFSSASVSHA